MNMNPLELLEKLIIEHGSATVLGKHLLLIKDQLQISEKKVTELEKENGELKYSIAQLTAELQKIMIPKDYFEYRGVLFRRTPEGKVLNTIYCPECKRPLRSLMDELAFACEKCQFSASFNGKQLVAILQEVAAL